MLKKPAILFCCSLLAATLQLEGADEQPSANQESASPIISTPVITPSQIVTSTTPFTPFTGVICGSKVRMRTQPSLESHVIRETGQGEIFAVVSETCDYYAVMPPKGTKGYVFRTYILDGTVEGERVNVRLSPDTEAPVVAQLNRGTKVEASVSHVNNKWLEIDLPETSRFYIAKGYLENIGSIELVASFEQKKIEAAHHLSAASLFAQAEIQKPFEEIDFAQVQSTFEKIKKNYPELPTIVEQAVSITALLEDIYIQKKISFLEGRSNSVDSEKLVRIAQLAGEERTLSEKESKVENLASAAADVIGLAATISDNQITDKMLAWQPLEESIYHLWAVSHGEKSIEEFYDEEKESAMMISGIVEPYNRPVKNRPGDFILKNGNHPIAFLYSTRINLEKLVGQNVTVVALPRPNHHFAFPAYFVLNIE
jgi:SH3-like domain-containing protein